MNNEKPPAKAEADNFQGPVPKDEQAQEVGEQPAAFRHVGEDPYWTQLEDDVSLVKEVTGIDDDNFCRGLVLQVYGVMPKEEYDDRTSFNFVVSILSDHKSIDKTDAELNVHMAICHLALMRQAGIFLRPVRYELPDDFAVALLHSGWDTSWLEKRKFKVGDQAFFKSRARMSIKLMQTFVMLLDASTRHRMAAQSMMKVQQISMAPAEGHVIGGDSAQLTLDAARKNGAATRPRGTKRRRQSARSYPAKAKHVPNSIRLSKANGKSSP